MVKKSFNFSLKANSPQDTTDFARNLSKFVAVGDVLLLDGELGAGKTHFSRALITALGIEESVISPTFVIVREYQNSLPIYHADLYRIGPEEFFALGYIDILGTEGIFLIEWGSKIADFIDDFILINFEILDFESRLLHIEGHGVRGNTLAEKWRKSLS